MSTRRQRLAPRVEQIEQRTMPSGGFAGLAPTAVVAPRETGRHIALDGTLRGGYQTSVFVPDVGSTLEAMGSGRVGHIGQTTSNANFHSTGFILQGNATGTLTLSGTRGTVTFALTGPQQPGFARLPNTFQYTIISGTGAYKNAYDHGLAHLITKPSGSEQNVNAPETGSFTLVLHSRQGIATI